MPVAPPILQVSNIEVVYEKVILAVHGVSLTVEEGQIVALLGANGAGKSSTLKAISSLVGAERGEVVSGSIVYRGHDITGAPPDVLVRDRLVQVLEGRRCFPHLSVEENLITGSFVTGGTRQARLADLERIYQYFPRLKERRRVAGVVNIILRKDFQGAEATVYYGVYDKGDGERMSVDAVIGAAGERFRSMMGVGYVKENPVGAGARTISAEPLYTTGTALQLHVAEWSLRAVRRRVQQRRGWMRGNARTAGWLCGSVHLRPGRCACGLARLGRGH